ncbi:MAG: putative rRNA maturation factor [Microgenomates group bacterium GW2011_GWA2_44_7]|nr:MAG: putative rRNA maturation factor [Microgenomates group bacterium GW2011_GWA2_44_7]
MINVFVSSPKAYAVNVSRLKKNIGAIFTAAGITSEAEVSVAFVSDRQMARISEKYLKDHESHEIISFPFETSEASLLAFPSPDGVKRIGEIIIAFPTAVKLAKKNVRSITAEIDFLLHHGCQHLLGYHH